jgi:branched-chain amino acid transport system substrate-binding protein
MTRKTLGVLGAGLLALAAVAPVSAQAPEDPLGVVTIPPGEPVVIAGWGVMSGADASLGQDWMNSMNVIAEDRGNELLGHPLELVFEDGLCTPEGGATAAQKLAADPTIVGLIGSACSDETVGGIAALTNAGLTTISPSNTRPALTAEDRGPEFAGYLRTAHNDLVQGAFVADFAYNTLGLRTAATIHDGSAYAEALQQVFQDEFTAMGGSIVTAQAVQKEQTDMRPVLTAIANSDPAPEMIYYPIFTAEGAFVTAQSKEVAGLEDVVLIGSDGMFSADMVSGAGPAAVGMYLSSPAVTGDAYTEFLARYEEVNGVRPPQAFHAHGADAMNILLAAIEQVAVQGDDGTLYVPKGALRDAIYATADYAGLTGTITCTPTGDCGAGAIGAYVITEDVVNGTWPPPLYEGE